MTIWTWCFKQATFDLYTYLICIIYVPNVHTIVGFGPPHAYSTHHLMLLVPSSLSLPHFVVHLLVNSIQMGALCCDHNYHTVKTSPSFFLCICGYLPRVELSRSLRSILWISKVLPLVGPFPNGKTIHVLEPGQN